MFRTPSPRQFRTRNRQPHRPGVRGLLAGGAVLSVLGLLTGCGPPPDLAQADPSPTRPRIPSAVPTTPGGPAIPTLPPTNPPTAGGLAPVDCAGSPSGAKVIALLRRAPAVVSAGIRVTVRRGPLCADGWQYTIVQVTGREPLQVVSTGPAADLRLVTAGTNVCTAEVRVAAPPGIRSIACDAALPGAGTGLPAG